MFVLGCHMMKKRDEWQATQEILVSIRKQKENKERKNSTTRPLFIITEKCPCMHVCVCVCVCVCVFASLRHMVVGLHSTRAWHDEKSGIVFLSAMQVGK